MKKISIILGFVLSTFGIRAQSIERFVVSSAGMESTGGVLVSATLGEPATFTIGSQSTGVFLTQGFQQPAMVSIMNMLLSLNTTIVDSATCPQAADGQAKIIPLNGTPPYTYVWAPSISTADSATGLSVGQYLVSVSDALGRTGTVTIDIANKYDKCDLTFYTGMTPNGDSHNDTWIVDGLEFHPDNNVKIFNRCGDLIWKGNSYDNVNVVFRGKGARGEDVSDGTYYYLINAGGMNYKGWFELTH